jgi:hypothetical protein
MKSALVLEIIVLLLLIVITIITMLANNSMLKKLEKAVECIEEQKEVLNILINSEVKNENYYKTVETIKKALVTKIEKHN